ncbi:hypothetical protein GEOBRER4_n2784 [Citrifermentans bremense]|uniref:Uncharacterized protein n=1 Tax=Citrifermentans bremense TaxID=60035 RepID=A0A7R7IYR6_9BACT|nr:hypothetical protein GEOBRER4_n2784 [Citrifermentans bremense]
MGKYLRHCIKESGFRWMSQLKVSNIPQKAQGRLAFTGGSMLKGF